MSCEMNQEFCFLLRCSLLIVYQKAFNATHSTATDQQCFLRTQEIGNGFILILELILIMSITQWLSKHEWPGECYITLM
jgi:hypothetical protein